MDVSDQFETQHMGLQPWQHRMLQEAIEEAKRRKKRKDNQEKYARFQADPVGFIHDYLGATYHQDIINLIESVRDNPVTIAKSANGVGKTHSAARIALWFYLAFYPAEIYVAAAPPLENLQRLLWGEISAVVQDKPELFNKHNIYKLRIDRGPISFITGVSIPQSGTAEERKAKFSGKHSPNLLFICDEGDAIPDEVYDGIESCMSGGNAHLLIMFNPRAARGPVYEKEFKKMAHIVELSAFNHPNVLTGENLVPGAVTRNVTVRRINEWTRPMMPDENPDAFDHFEVPEFLTGYKAKSLAGIEYPPLTGGKRVITDPAFSYMVLGRYPAQSMTQLISEEWINKAVMRWQLYVAKHGEVPPEGIRPKLGLDVAEYGVDFNVVYLRYGGFVSRSIRWDNVDPIVSGDKTLVICHEKNVDMAYVDAIGYGAAIAPYIMRQDRHVRAISAKVSEKPSPVFKLEQGEFYSLRDQLWWLVREWLRTDDTAMIPPEPMLIEELKTPTYEHHEKTGTLRVMDKDSMREMLHRSPNYADALCLTFFPQERAKVISVDIKEQSYA